MLPPARLLVGTGCLVVAIVANKLRQRNESIQRSKKQQNQTVVRDVKEVVHAYASMSPAVPVSQQMVSPAGLRGSRGLLAICTLLICSALVTAALREQWDVVASVGMAWTLLLLNQVLPASWGAGWSSNSRALSDVDAAVVVDEPEPVKMQDLAGTWIKDNAACDRLDPAMDLMHLNGLVRTAAKLIKGVKITLDDQQFSFGAFSVISWFKITESYLLNGELSHCRRRDFRRGKSRGSISITPWGSIRLDYHWDDPHSGTGVDEFLIDSDGRLNVVTTVTVAGRSESYTLRYHRR